MKEVYLRMMYWLELPKNKTLSEAYKIKAELIDYFINDNQLAICNYLIKFAEEIDKVFGCHTSEQLMQFVW